jgi:ubiquinone/menaquinone biosynthesis C-methylase UbiE
MKAIESSNPDDPVLLHQVEDFWEKNLCGHHFIQDPYLSREFFRHYTEFRFRKAHHLNCYIDWASARGRDLLEIGLGIGADAVRWAQHARSFCGVDLTYESVKATRKHFSLMELKGCLMQGNAQQLHFKDEQFDIIYSYGVLHHTPDISRALSEIHRVLKRTGTFILMLYARESFNFYIRIQLYFRLRMLVEIFKKKLGLTSHNPWKQHLQNYKEIGWRYLYWQEFPHHCTDGPDCKIANIFNKRTIKKMLNAADFEIEKTIKAHFPLGGKFPSLERWMGKYIGFHRLIWAKKV